MLRTISLGRYMSVQGVFVKTLDNGSIVVRVGKRFFEGPPVGRKAA